MKSPDQAAALIQARWKGCQCRVRQRRYIISIIKLQARQRGRAVRREYVPFREFRREQHAFEVESKARRARIWHHQQQLQYMESISPVQYDRLVALQKRRSARLIQRRWKEYTLSANYQRNFHHHHDWDTDEDDTNDLNQSSESAPSSFTPSKAIDAMTFLAKKQEIHQRIRDAVRQISVKHPWKIPATGSTKADGDAARRATYEKLQRETANWTARFNEHCTTLRQPKRASDASVFATLARCDHRLRTLVAPTLLTSLSNDTPSIEGAPPKPSIPRLPKDPARRDVAVATHRSVIQSIDLASKAAWNMPVAGHVYDMRQIELPPPWAIEGQDKIWTWPHSFRVDVTTTSSPPPRQSVTDANAAASDDSCADDDSIRQFLTRSSTPHVKSGSNGTLSTNPSPSLDKHEHALDPAMSSHLWLHYADAMSTPSAAMLANVTSIMTTHPALLAYQQPSLKATDDVFGLTFDAIVRSQTAHLVADITSQITFNTQLRSVQDHTKKATSMGGGDEDASDVAFPGGLVDYGGLRRHHMATRIQRRVRGNKGRVEAQEIRATYFVQVKGRAVRKGLCEECGDVRAVLKCDECEETTHFCPQCWVHVHSTRRRKAHAPSPLVIGESTGQSTTGLHKARGASAGVGGSGGLSSSKPAPPQGHINSDMEDMMGKMAMQPPRVKEDVLPESNISQPTTEMPGRIRRNQRPMTPQPERSISTVVVAADAMLLGLVQQVAHEQESAGQ